MDYLYNLIHDKLSHLTLFMGLWIKAKEDKGKELKNNNKDFGQLGDNVPYTLVSFYSQRGVKLQGKTF